MDPARDPTAGFFRVDFIGILSTSGELSNPFHIYTGEESKLMQNAM